MFEYRSLELAEVPSVVGQSQADAQTAITEASLTVTITSEIDDDFAPGVVVSQNPPAGTMIQPGAAVTIGVNGCVATVLDNGNVQISWSAFNGEDDRYQVRRNNRWRAAIAFDATLQYVDQSPQPGDQYEIRSWETGGFIDQPCNTAR